MKNWIYNLLLGVLFFTNFVSFSQQSITINRVESTLITNQGVNFIGSLKQPNNDFYVFENFNNSGIIFLNGESFAINNINFNVTTNNFESRLNRNDYFVYNNASIDFIVINSRNFKKIGNIFYEVLVEHNDSFLLKKHIISFLKGVDNRLVGTVEDSKPIIDFKYLVKDKDTFVPIELNKRGIFDFFKDKEDILERFLKSTDLSYRNEEDLAKIVEYMFSNP